MTLKEVRKWVADAIADGWKAEPTYKNESIDRAVTMKKDGWTVMCIIRSAGSGPMNPIVDSVSMNIWAPDSLAVKHPNVYSMSELEENATRCQYCGKKGKTCRIGFAGRCCSSCHAENVDKVEYPGWCD